MSFRHQFYAFIVALIWGTNFVFIKYGLDELPPLLFATLRFALVAFSLILFLPKPDTRWRLIAAYGVLIGFGQFGILFIAMQQDISAGLASLVVQMQVFFSILLAIVFFKERVAGFQWLALFVSFLGVAIITSQVEGDTTILGVGLVLIAALNWSFANIVVKQAGKVSIIAFIAYSSVFAVPVLAITSLYFEGWQLITQQLQAATVVSFYVVAWQSIGNTLIGYGLWNFLLSRYEAAVVVPWALLVPISGMAASYALLAEPMPFWKLLAAFVVIMGLAINMVAVRKN